MSSRRLFKALGWLDLSRYLSVAGLAVRDAAGGVGLRLWSDQEHLQATMDWLCRAQDAEDRGGVAGGYSLRDGWLEPCPETTGYIIETFLSYAHFTGLAEYAQRARRMADWELEIQMSDGAVPGATGANSHPSVFNTGQVILGWLAMYRHTSDSCYLEAARRAADWLVSAQDKDGKWSGYENQGIPHAYHSRVAWPMLEAHAITQDPAHRGAAERNVRWVLTLATENGWIRDMGFNRNEPPFTHTIAYTLRGLLECARLLDGDIVPRIQQVVNTACERVLMRYECRKRDPRGMPEYLPGRFDENWRPQAGYSCLTGNLQFAVTFIKLFEQGGDPRFLNAALKLIDQVKATQSLRAIHPAIRGAVAGSYPIWGGYMPFGYPSWAAKFLADALMVSRRVLAHLHEEAAK